MALAIKAILQGYGIVIAFKTGSSKVDVLRLIQIMVISLLGFALFAHAGNAEKTGTVMVSAKPLAMIYVALRPQQPVIVLLPADQDMHEYSLAIRDIQRLQSAQAFFWLGEKSEPFLATLNQRLAGQHNWVSVAENTTHAWLDQRQLPALVNTMAQALAKQYPAEKKQIEANRTALIKSINSRYLYWQQRLKPYTNKPFLLGHDAYHAFAKNIGLQQAVLYRASSDHGHVQAGMYEILDLQKRIAQGEITCAMEEPEVSFATLSKRYRTLKIGHLEPMAANIALDANAYPAFIDASAQAFETCLHQGVK